MTDVLLPEALGQLEELADEQRASEMAAYHKIDRRYLGIANPAVDPLVKDWRANCSLEARIALASGLWDSGIHEAMVAAAKLLTQARIRPDDTPAWDLIAGWAETFEGWAVADHASSAGGRRLRADPSRLDHVETWTQHPNMWTRRAALVMTLPWARLTNPKAHETETRQRVLNWCAVYATDHDWFIQKAIGWWLRELSKHAPQMTLDWTNQHGSLLKPFARKEALRLLDL